MILKVKKLYDDAVIPWYSTDGAVGFDLHSYEDVTLKSGEMKIVCTGIAVEVPEGYEMTVRQRSGLSIFHPNYIAICIGTIDSDYRGEIKMPIINNADLTFTIKKGDRIAQCVISPIIRCYIKEVQKLSETKRNTSGFGHTGR